MPNRVPQLYPPLEPYATHRLVVSGLHTLYVEESGNPDGQPVVFVHGGPGGGCEPWYRQFFDPRRYRIVLFDQRGCGRSTPHAELRENTTWDLVADMERIREHLGIERWVLFGGSWGSTLSLTYAETHPERVIGLILRGIFLLRRAEIEWFYQSGASWFFPEPWEAYLAEIPVSERDDMVSAYYRRLTHDDAAVRRAAARAWSMWEGATSKLVPSAAAIRPSRVAASFHVTMGRPRVTARSHGRLRRAASWAHSPRRTRTPAASSAAAPPPACSVGSSWA